MAVGMEAEESLRAKFSALLPHLDERQQRLYLGSEARALGHGGVAVVARAAGVSRVTVSAGAREMEAGDEPLGRARRPGGGRKRAADADPGLVPALLALVEPGERGDPMSPLRWTTKSTRNLAGELTRQGHKAGPDTVGDLLRAEGFSLQGNAKIIEGAQHPDRDAQFRYIAGKARDHQDAGDPVISVDTKKKELIGEFANAGREWRPRGEPTAVRTHDFPGDSAGKAIPYGIYDVTADAGWVNAGTDHDTAAFAVESVRRWWNAAGSSQYPRARRLLITADAGGSNGYRTRAWKTGLAALAAETGMEIMVCHFPPGTSKWNKIEHRLFSHITMNWRGRPLTSHDVIISNIAATTTRTGLTVDARLDDGTYPTGVKVGNALMAALPISRHLFHGDWNYTLHPAAGPTAVPPAGSGQQRGPAPLPELTGLAPAKLDELIAQLAALRQAQREQRARAHPAGDARHKPRSGRPPAFPFPDRVVATVLHLRLALPDDTLAHLLGTNRTTMRRALAEIRDLLDQHGHRIEPATAPPGLPTRIPPYIPQADGNLENKEVKSAC
jgi:DDE family transposase